MLTSFETINAKLAKKGLLMRQGTIVDATIIAAPSLALARRWLSAPQGHRAS